MSSKTTRMLVWSAVALSAAAAGVFDASTELFPVDFSIFGRAADTLLSASWADAFSSPEVQVGPLHLLWMGILRAAARAAGLPYREVFAVATQVSVALGVMAVIRSVSDRPWVWGEALGGSLTVVGGLGWVAYISGHPEELLIGLLWTWAAVNARRGRAARAGVVLAVAAGLKLAGVLGLPVLLLLPARRDRLRSLALFAALVVLTYAPFFVFGEVATFEYSWPIESGLLGAIAAPGADFSWWLRTLQACAAVALGGLAAVRLGRYTQVVWLAPMAIVAARVLLDPLPHYYLWMPFDALGLVAATALAWSRPLPVQLLAFGSGYALLLVRYLPAGPGQGARIALLALLAWLVVGWSDSDPAPAGGPGSGREEPVAGPRRPAEAFER